MQTAAKPCSTASSQIRSTSDGPAPGSSSVWSTAGANDSIRNGGTGRSSLSHPPGRFGSAGPCSDAQAVERRRVAPPARAHLDRELEVHAPADRGLDGRAGARPDLADHTPAATD